VGSFFSAIGSFIGGFFSAIGGFFSGFFGGAFGRGGSSGGSGGSSGGSSGGGGSMSVLPQSSRAGSGPSSSEVSSSFISSAYNFGSSVGSALGSAFRAVTANIGGASFEGASNWLSGQGFRTDLGVYLHNYQREDTMIHALNINENDTIPTTGGSRTLGYPNGLLGKISPSGHAWARWDEGRGKIDIGPNEKTGLFDLTERWSVDSTDRYRHDYPNAGITIMVSESGLRESIALWQKYFGNLKYAPFRYNSNYGMVGILYGAGANVEDLANIGPVRIIGFPNYPLDND
jgi:hypothetical protein